jgi:hypothetical protein
MDGQFTMIPYNEKYLQVVDVEKVYDSLDLLISSINMVLANRYVKKLRPQAEKTKKDLMKLSEFFDDVIVLQRTWKYMERIFQGSEIKAMLPVAAAQFVGVSKFWEACAAEMKRQHY